MALVTAPVSRDWMDSKDRFFAKRCLPLLIANQSGWFILNSHSFRVIWDGGKDRDSLQMLYMSGEEPYPATSTFGGGIITFKIPYVFRTSPGYNLLVRGPANCPKDGVSPLEGVVETEWAVATFTMNWQVTRPNHLIQFEKGEPICMLVPQRRGELESFSPTILNIRTETELNQDFREWSDSRRNFSIRLSMSHPRSTLKLWQRHYFRGTSPSGKSATTHQTRLALRPFISGGSAKKNS